MGLRTTCPYCGTKYFSITKKRCPTCDDIDFDNIEMIYLADAETAYRIETEEEFDIVMSNYLTELDGWQHYETKTVEYEVQDGENYTFVIIYKNKRREYRKYHSSSEFANRLLNHRKILNFDDNFHEDTEKTTNLCEIDCYKQVIKSAAEFLNCESFSKQGLIEQLEFEGFSREQATYAVNNCSVNWNDQAAKSAAEYLSCESFSKQELIEQLKYDGFTHEQAVYGVIAVGYKF